MRPQQHKPQQQSQHVDGQHYGHGISVLTSHIKTNIKAKVSLTSFSLNMFNFEVTVTYESYMTALCWKFLVSIYLRVTDLRSVHAKKHVVSKKVLQLIVVQQAVRFRML